MKAKILAIFVLLTASTSLMAQSENSAQVSLDAPVTPLRFQKINLKLGVAKSNIVDPDGETLGAYSEVKGRKSDTVDRTGFTVGVLTEISRKSTLSLETGLVYQQLGATTSQDIFGLGQTETTLALDYIKVPLLMKVDFSRSSNTAPFIKLGPSYSQLVSKQYKVSSSKTTKTNTVAPVTDINQTQFGLEAGLGLRTSIGADDLLFELTYERGLTPLYQSELGQEAYNSSLNLSVGVGLTL